MKFLKGFLYISFFLFGLFFIFAIFTQSGVQASSFSFSINTTNKDFSINTKTFRVTHDGDVYSNTENGAIFLKENSTLRNKVLSLAQFYEISLYDPLFYSPELDIESWEKSIKKLKEERESLFAEMKEVISKDFSKLETYKNILGTPEGIYPVNFLESFISAVAVQEEFLNNSSYKNAKKLINVHKNTAQFYAKSAEQHLVLLQKSLEGRNPITSMFIGSATSDIVLKSDLELIKDNGEQLLEEVKMREKCLLYGSCDNVFENEIKTVQTNNEITDDPFLYTEIPVELLTPPYTTEVAGPFLIESSCWGKTNNLENKKWPVYLFIGTYEETKTALPMLASEHFYWDVRTESDVLNQEKVEMGITYNDQAATNPYMCADNTYFSDSLTVHGFKKYLLENEILFPQESVFISKKIPSSSDLLILNSLYKKNRNNDKEHNKRFLMTGNKLLGLNLALGKLSEMVDVYRMITLINKEPYRDFMLLGARSSYSMLYMPFASSIWRLNNTPQYLFQHEVFRSTDKYFSYNEALKEPGFNPALAKVWDTDINKLIIKENNPKKSFSGSLLSVLGGLLNKTFKQ